MTDQHQTPTLSDVIAQDIRDAQRECRASEWADVAAKRAIRRVYERLAQQQDVKQEAEVTQ